MTKHERQRRESAVQARSTASFSQAVIALDEIMARCASLDDTIESSDGVPISTVADGEEDSLVTAIDDTRAKLALVAR